MAFSPAWGGVIPLVPIGSFRGFLEARKSGKDVKQWFTGTVTRTVVTQALKTTLGRRVAADMSAILKVAGFKAAPGSIAIELQGYIAFQKFQHQQAVAKRDRSAQRRIEKIMALPRDFPKSGAKAFQFPLAYFETLAKTGGGPRTKNDEERRRALLTWFDRRKYRRGRFSNV